MGKTNEGNKDGWLSSKETQQRLKISGCELMHRRESGKLAFKKQGNAYCYFIKANLQVSSDGA